MIETEKIIFLIFYYKYNIFQWNSSIKKILEIIIAFYFGTQSQKKAGVENENKSTD